MSVVFPLGTPRYTAASLLIAYGAMTSQAIAAKCKAAGQSCSTAELRSALIGLRRAGLAVLDASCQRWSLTTSGRKYWKAQHASQRFPATDATVDQETTAQASPILLEWSVSKDMLTSGIVRLSSPADRLPMVHRPGSLDAANLPSIEGPWRIWRDGRREPKDAA